MRGVGKSSPLERCLGGLLGVTRHPRTEGVCSLCVTTAVRHVAGARAVFVACSNTEDVDTGYRPGVEARSRRWLPVRPGLVPLLYFPPL